MINLIKPIYFEEWKPITDDIIPEVKPFYMISNFGRIYSIQHNKILKQYVYPNTGYVRVVLRMNNDQSKDFTVHRLVSIAFNKIPNYDQYEVNHIDGNKLNNCIWNLEWVTRKENIDHAWSTGLYSIGEDHHNANLSNNQVHIICKGLEDGKSYEEICSLANIEYNSLNSSCISDIRYGRRWNHISCNYKFPEERSYQLFSNNQVHQICKYFEQNKDITYDDILINLGIDIYGLDKKTLSKYRGCIGRIFRRERFTNISKNYNY